MGWSKKKINETFLAEVLTDFKKKSLNAIFLNYNKDNGFGKKEKIDIWWNGKGRLITFALNLIKFIQSDKTWIDSEIRILVINNDSTIADKFIRSTNALLEEKRVKAEIKILTDDFGSRTKENIINYESKDADLVIIGVSQNQNSYHSEYITYINQLSKLNAN